MNKELLCELKNSMSEKRWKHSQGVEAEAVKLAKIYGADEKKAALAGILHDCAKGMSIEEQLEKCSELKIALDREALDVPAVIHAPLGAELAKIKYGIYDEDIIEAIRKHTVGAGNMTKLDKIIYLADMIEPSRSFDGVDELRSMAYKDLDAAMLMALEQSIVFNIKKKTIIHTATVICRNGIIKNMEEKNVR